LSDVLIPSASLRASLSLGIGRLVSIQFSTAFRTYSTGATIYCSRNYIDTFQGEHSAMETPVMVTLGQTDLAEN